MPMMSKNVTLVQPSLTMIISSKAQAMRADGIDVIALSAGEPDFPTPDFICEAGIEAIRGGFTRYTPASGTNELKEAICEKFKNDNELDYQTSQVMINCGAKHSVFLTVFVLTNPGDEVIVPSPYWVSYPEIVRLAGGTPVIVEGKQENKLKITPEQLKGALTDKTKLLLLNTPSNPTGMVYGREELNSLAEVIVEAGIHVLSDEIYEKLLYDGKTHVSTASLSEALSRLTITVNGVSKAYSMTGWRIGYAAGPEEIIRAMSTVQSQETSNPCSISQKAALAALTGPQEFLSEWVEEFSRRRIFLIDRLNAIEGVSCQLPEGAFYAFPKVSGLFGRKFKDTVIDGSVALCEYLLTEHHIALVPGAGFGADEHIRISYALSMDQLEKAFDRFEKGVQTLQK